VVGPVTPDELLWWAMFTGLETRLMFFNSSYCSVYHTIFKEITVSQGFHRDGTERIPDAKITLKTGQAEQFIPVRIKDKLPSVENFYSLLNPSSISV
jgi:hypothetical protein